MLECDRPDNEKHKEPLDKKIFKPWFKHCPDCGGLFVEMDNKHWKCDECGKSAFRAHDQYSARFSMWRRENFKDYHHGD